MLFERVYEIKTLTGKIKFAKITKFCGEKASQLKKSFECSHFRARTYILKSKSIERWRSF